MGSYVLHSIGSRIGDGVALDEVYAGFGSSVLFSTQPFENSIGAGDLDSLRKVLMKPLFTFMSDNGPFLLICGVVVAMAASLLLYTAAYLHN